MQSVYSHVPNHKGAIRRNDIFQGIWDIFNLDDWVWCGNRAIE